MKSTIGDEDIIEYQVGDELFDEEQEKVKGVEEGGGGRV